MTTETVPTTARQPDESYAAPLPPPASPRRHDLDALRGVAMLLGIALHAALSFGGTPWTVMDTQQSRVLLLFFEAVHGFRMQLFFLLSGFFSMMIFRRRGLGSLLTNRTLRILIPCLLGLVTIQPVTGWVSEWVNSSASRSATTEDSPLVKAIRAGDVASVRQRLADGASPDEPDARFQVVPLAWAALVGQREIAEVLLGHGADTEGRNGNQSTPLHTAAFVGRDDIAELLIRHGADCEALEEGDRTPGIVTFDDPGGTTTILGWLGVPLRETEEVATGRLEIRQRIADKLGRPVEPPVRAAGSRQGAAGSLRDVYQEWMGSERFRVGKSEPRLQLFYTPVFGHLWFLWFLCWLSVLFAVLVPVARWLGLGTRADRIPFPVMVLLAGGLTLIPQWFMGFGPAGFGPDTSMGWLLFPHLLVYYGLFFFFGGYCQVAGDRMEGLTRRWWLLLPLGLLVLFPAGLATLPQRETTSVLQVAYAWVMIFGLIGFFQRVLTRESLAVRYLSDSSYWLYIAHLPLVFAAQYLVRDWPLPAIPKFLLVFSCVTLILLLSYQFFVRHTPIGWLLNGPRGRK